MNKTRKSVLYVIVAVFLAIVLIGIIFPTYILSLEPDKIRGYFYEDLSNLHEREGNYYEAEINRLLSIKHYPQIYKQQAIISSMLESNISALKDNPSDFHILREIIDEYLYKKWDCDNAMVYLEQAIKTDPKHAQSHYDLGSCYLFKQNFESAVKELELANSLDPNKVHYLINLESARNRLEGK